MNIKKKDIRMLSVEELKGYLAERNEKPFRAKGSRKCSALALSDCSLVGLDRLEVFGLPCIGIL